MGKIFGWGVVWMLLLFAGGCSTGEERQLDEALKLAGDNRSNHSIFRLDTHVPQTYLCAITQ